MDIRLDRPIVFIDLETTGLNPSYDRIVEITAIKVHPDGSEEQRTVRINPEMRIPAAATSVHGITDEDVVNHPPFSRYAKNLLAFLDGSDLAGFNAIRFDLPMLRAEFARVGVRFDLEGRNVIDPMAIFHQMEPRDLAAAYKRYCGKAMDNAHTSLGDVKAAMGILEAQLKDHPELGSSMESLHAFCHPRQPDWLDDEGKVVLTDEGPALGFGKHRGRLVKDIAELDADYLDWILYGNFTEQVKQAVRQGRST